VTRSALVVNPRVGKTTSSFYEVAAQEGKPVVLRRQGSGTIVKVTFAGNMVKCKLKC
jgi:hypothetical protein